MEAYTSFARVYDMFMDNVPYEVWGRYIVEKLRANGIDSGYVVDLAVVRESLPRFLQMQAMI